MAATGAEKNRNNSTTQDGTVSMTTTKNIAVTAIGGRSRMISFEDLQRANQQITTTNIKGKEYAEVNQRIKAFRMVYPEGFITTDIKYLESGMCVIHARCGVDERILGEGTAYEKESSSFINKTSYIENCETSAVGRALGMAGFGIDTSVCSAEELSNAQLQQEASEPINKGQVKTLTEIANKVGSDLKDICGYFNVESIDKMTVQDYGKCLIMLKKKEEKKDEQ